MSKTDPTFIQRGDENASSQRRAALEKAKLRAAAGGSRPGPMENAPRFDQVDLVGKTMKPAPGFDTPPPGLSKQTADALAAVEAANQHAASPLEEPVYAEKVSAHAEGPLSREDIAEIFGIPISKAGEIFDLAYPSEDDNISLRRKVESRLPPLDIGEFLMNGSATQVVPLIPASETLRKGLSITFQSITEAAEAAVDYRLSSEGAKIRKERDGEKFIDVEMSQREYVRRQNEYALAVHVHAYGDQKWPPLLTSAGAVDEVALDTRMLKVRQIPAPLFVMAIQNLSWFLARLQRTLEVAVLGNG